MLELPEPLDLAASEDLLRAFNTYSKVEQDLWDDVAADLLQGKLKKTGEDAAAGSSSFPDTFVLRPQGGTVGDVLQ